MICVITFILPILTTNSIVFALSRDILFDQSATGQFAFCQSMLDSVYPFESKIADNFAVATDAYIDSLVWWGGYWSMITNYIVDFQIEFYEDSTGYQQPKQNPVYSERTGFNEIDLGGYYRYEATIPQFAVSANQTYWIATIAHLVWPPHWGNNCSWPTNPPAWGDGQESYYKSTLFGYDVWVTASSSLGEPYETSFLIMGSSSGISERENSSIKDISSPLRINKNPITDNHVFFTCAIHQDEPVSLYLFDCAGRHIRTIVLSNKTSGILIINWDLKDKNGEPVKNGVYFAISESASIKGIVKFVIQR